MSDAGRRDGGAGGEAHVAPGGAGNARSPASARAAARARLASREVFYGRLRRSATYALGLTAATLAIGTIGYAWLAHLAWIDAFHQAALLMSGMGPLDESGWSTAAKLFDGIYALFCGMILLLATGILFAPILHRLVHRFHLQDVRDD